MFSTPKLSTSHQLTVVKFLYIYYNIRFLKIK
nr:MAG TPA: hypothetical protein [Caudoviricetes sp.]